MGSVIYIRLHHLCSHISQNMESSSRPFHYWHRHPIDLTHLTGRCVYLQLWVFTILIPLTPGAIYFAWVILKASMFAPATQIFHYIALWPCVICPTFWPSMSVCSSNFPRKVLIVVHGSSSECVQQHPFLSLRRWPNPTSLALPPRQLVDVRQQVRHATFGSYKTLVSNLSPPPACLWRWCLVSCSTCMKLLI